MRAEVGVEKDPMGMGVGAETTTGVAVGAEVAGEGVSSSLRRARLCSCTVGEDITLEWSEEGREARPGEGVTSTGMGDSKDDGTTDVAAASDPLVTEEVVAPSTLIALL